MMTEFKKTKQISDDFFWKDKIGREVTDIFDEFQKNNINFIKKYLNDLELIITEKSNSNDYRSYFYFNLIEYMKLKKIMHSNLISCENHLNNKINEFYHFYNMNNSMPPLNSEEGQVYTLSFIGKILPLDTYHLQVSVIPRFILFKLDYSDLIKAILYIIFKTKGFGPILEMHLPKMNKNLSLDLVYSDYINIARIVCNNKKIKGTYQSNWFLDPYLAEISPHLIDIQGLAKKHGSIVIDLGNDHKLVSDATYKSKKRRDLYQQGLYMPRRFARIWSRKDIVKFYEENIKQELEKI